MSYTYTTQRQVRAAFWDAHKGVPGITRKKVVHMGFVDGPYHNTDTRCAFADFVDALCKDGQISDSLADRVTL